MSRKHLPPRISLAQAQLLTLWRAHFGPGNEHAGSLRQLLAQYPDVQATTSGTSRRLRTLTVLRQARFLIRLPDQGGVDHFDALYYAAADRAFRVELPRRHTS